MDCRRIALAAVILLATFATACASNGPPSFTRVSASPQIVARGGRVQISAPATDPDGDALKYSWAVSKGWTLEAGGDGAAVVKAPGTAGADGLVTASVSDGHGHTATASIAVSTSKNHAPAIASVAATPNPVKPGGSVTISVAATDADADPLTYAWTAPTGWTIADATKATTTLTAPSTFDTAGVIEVTVDDGQGGTVTGSVLVHTTADRAPVITALDAIPNPVMPGGTVSLTASATSPSGNTISYSWALSDASWTLAGATTDNATLTAPSAYASAVIATVTADDGQGGTSTASVVVSTIADAVPQITSITATPSPAIRGMPVTLSAAAQDPDGDTIGYAWSLVAMPAGSAAALSDPAAVNPTFTPDVAGTYTVRLVVKDTPGGQASAPFDLQLKPVNGTPTAVIAGTAPLSAVMNTGLTLDGSGSSTPAGDPLTYRWRVTTTPAGGRAAITPVGNGSTATFDAEAPGTYTVGLDVTDPYGDTGSTTTTIDVAGATKLVMVSGNNQSATVATDLAAPLVVQAQTAGGTPVPGVRVDWLPAGASLKSPGASTTDASGNAEAVLHVSRIAGGGSVVARLHAMPTTADTFGFTATAGTVASVAASVTTGNTDAGAMVTVQPVDMYGNPTTRNPVANVEAFRLIASGSATFGTTPAVGTLFGGGGTNQIDGALGSGIFQIPLNDTVAETVNVTIEASPGYSAFMPYSGWQEAFEDDAEAGIGGWTTAGAPAWQVENGATKAHGGGRSLGVELQGSDTAVNSWSVLDRVVSASGSPIVELHYYQHLDVASAHDATNDCTAQPDFFLAARQCSGINCGEMPLAPRMGYPVTDACSGQLGFGTVQGWKAHLVDLTDAVNGGYSHLQFDMSNRPDAATPAAASDWRVDDLRVTYLGRPGTTGTATTIIRPGAPAKVMWTAGTYGGASQVLYDQCINGIPPVTATAEIVDANGNVTEDSQMVFQLNWTGYATATQASAGTVVAVGSLYAEVQFEQGRAGIVLADTTPQGVTLSLTDPRGTGLTIGPNAIASFVTNYCHDNGFGQNWSDSTAVGTYNATEATRACNETYGVGQCTSDSNDAYTITASSTCGYLSPLWTYATFAATDSCTFGAQTLNQGYLTGVAWISPTDPNAGNDCYYYCSTGAVGGAFSVPTGFLNVYAWQ